MEPDAPFTTRRRNVGICPESNNGRSSLQSAASQPTSSNRFDIASALQSLGQYMLWRQFSPAHAQGEVGCLAVLSLAAAQVDPANGPPRGYEAGAVVQLTYIGKRAKSWISFHHHLDIDVKNV